MNSPAPVCQHRMVVDDNNNANAGRGVQHVPDVHGIRKIDLSAATVKKAGAVAKIYAVDIFARRVKSRRLVGVADRKELLSSGVFIDMDDFFLFGSVTGSSSHEFK